MLSLTTEHAIRALLFLAQRPAGEAVSAERIAGALGAPANYMGKTLNQLARRGLLHSTRGPQGGFRLAVDPAAVSIATVAEIYDEPRGRGICLLGGRPCSDETPCRAHARWNTLLEGVSAPLRNTTIADLLEQDAGQDLPGQSAGLMNPAV